MDIKWMVVLCVTILAGTAAICLASVMLAYRRKARRGQGPFGDGVAIRIIGVLGIVVAAIYLAAADILTESLLVLFSALTGFLLGGASRPPRPGGGGRDRFDHHDEPPG